MVFLASIAAGLLFQSISGGRVPINDDKTFGTELPELVTTLTDDEAVDGMSERYRSAVF